MKKIPKDPNWHYLKWLGIAVVSILLFGIINNIDKSISILSLILDVFSPIFIGIFFAIMLNIPVSIFENKIFGKLTRKNGKIWSKIKRAVSIILSIASFFLIISIFLSFIIPEFIKTCQKFVDTAPKHLENLTAVLRELVVKFSLPIDPESINLSLESLAGWLTSTLGNNSSDIFQKTLTTAISVFNSVWDIVLGFILAIYIVISKESLSKLVKGITYSLISKNKADRVVYISRLSKNAFEGFIVGQCIEVLLIGTLTFIGMCIFKFPYALMISCIIGITNFIPIFGAIMGAIIGAFLIFLVDPIKAIWFLVFIIILQQIESNVIYPKIMGQQVGVPSLWIFVAVILGGDFFGIPGIIISVPLCSVVYTLLHEWVLKSLREKKLCKQSATHIPDKPTLLSDEEFLASDEEDENINKNIKDKKSSSNTKVKINQKNSNSTKKKNTKGSKK